MSTERTSNLRPLSDYLREKAKRELNEDPATRIQAIEELKATYKEKYPELPLLREDDLFIIRFLRARKYNSERALAILFNYHKFLAENSQFNQKSSEEDARLMSKHKVVAILEMKAKSDASIMYLQASSLDPDNFTADEMQKSFGFFWDQMMEDEATQICGVVLLEDLDGFTLSKANKIQKFQDKHQGGQANQFHFIQNCLPLRFKGVHLTHQVWYLTVVMAVAKTFMSKKLSERFFYHGAEVESLEKHFSLKGLPKQVGGELELDFEHSFAVCEAWRTRAVVEL